MLAVHSMSQHRYYENIALALYVLTFRSPVIVLACIALIMRAELRDRSCYRSLILVVPAGAVR